MTLAMKRGHVASFSTHVLVKSSRSSSMEFRFPDRAGEDIVPVLALVPASVRPGWVRPTSFICATHDKYVQSDSKQSDLCVGRGFSSSLHLPTLSLQAKLREICKPCCSFWLVAKRQTADVLGLPRGSIVVPFWGSYTESYKGNPKKGTTMGKAIVTSASCKSDESEAPRESLAIVETVGKPAFCAELGFPGPSLKHNAAFYAVLAPDAVVIRHPASCMGPSSMLPAASLLCTASSLCIRALHRPPSDRS